MIRRIILTTAADTGTCGYSFEEGEPYLVYAYGDAPESLTATLCSRTRTLAEADEDLQALGAPERSCGAAAS